MWIGMDGGRGGGIGVIKWMGVAVSMYGPLVL